MACFAITWSSALLFLIPLLLCPVNRIVVADPIYVRSDCPKALTITPHSEYQTNVNTLMSFLSSNTSVWRIFYSTSIGSGANMVYGAFFCRVDQTIDFCQECISLAIKSLTTNCHGAKEAIVWYDQCLVRYSNESFVGTMTDAPMIPMWNRRNAVDIQSVTSNQTAFTQVLLGTLRNVSSYAVTSSLGQKFATNEGKFVGNLSSLNAIYTLAECTPDISVSDCSTCLQMTIGNMTELCKLKAGCTVMCPNCNLRYDINAFYGDALTPALRPSSAPAVSDTSREVTPASRRKKTILLVSVIISAVLAVVILSAIWLFICRKKSNKAFTKEADGIEIVESLKFDLTTIRKATNNFSADKKLGEGGFGEVYKGELENGEYIAIKRLSSNSKQGIGEFKTEVAIVAKLQHRNLVKLLGFCLSTKEKILVYEFLPNMSLDRFLSDPTKRASLNWRSRFKIIVGIARGLLYLHEDSRLKIVHRDLKPSNILLNGDMHPKIADFGMARLFGVDQTQDNTDRIVGTFGYMAPEYIVAGHFSMKSDVYGFGIIVLELISGLRNKYLCQQQNDESLLYQAWKLWNEGTPLKLADPTLGNDYPVEEMTKCIHFGMLCIQEDAAKRPQMASIVSVLNGETMTLPSPTPPCFLTGSAGNAVENVGPEHYAVASGAMEDITEMYPR